MFTDLPNLIFKARETANTNILHGASAVSKLRSLAKCSLDDSIRRLL